MDLDITSYLLGKNSSGGGTTINNQDITVTENGVYTADSGYTGLGTVTVNVPTGGSLDLTSGVKFSYSTFATLPSIIQNSNWSEMTDLTKMFYYCSNLTTIPLIDTSNVENFTDMFNFCTSLSNIANLNTSSGSSFKNMFQRTIITTAPTIDTSKGTQFNNMFDSCHNLTTIPLLDMGKANDITNMFYNAESLTTIAGFKDLGKAYTTNATQYNSKYRLDLSYSTNLTHDSLMNIINNLYDIKTKGCREQKIKLSSTSIALLTEEEKAIATAKGWTIATS